MLILTRKPNETIKFPKLGISLEIKQVAGKTVRVGIDAPRDIRVIRGELESIQEPIASPGAKSPDHYFRNRCNIAGLSLHLVQKQLEKGMIEQAEMSLQKAIDIFSELENILPESGAAERSDPGSTRLKTLVVEDNAQERELMAGYLRLSGYDVDTAENGLTALKYLSNNPAPDAVLLDMDMPEMDGAATVSEIRFNSSYSDIKLFAVTGMNQRHSSIPVGKEGVDAWFTKPIQPNEFAGEIQSVLKN